MPTLLLPELLDRWVRGWCLSRGAACERRSYGWLVHVAADTRLTEHFAVSPTAAELVRLSDLADGRPEVWVTVLGELPTSRPVRLAAVTHDERMMIADLEARMLPAGIDIEAAQGVATAVAMMDDVATASGQVAVTGSDAVFDRVGTEPPFRRRGLAGRIMSGLEHWAVTQGAETGLLMASNEGRALYKSLGWREVAPLVTFRGDG